MTPHHGSPEFPTWPLCANEAAVRPALRKKQFRPERKRPGTNLEEELGADLVGEDVGANLGEELEVDEEESSACAP